MPFKILIVDDEPDVLFILGDVLNRNGYVVIKAKDGLETLSMVEHEKPDLIVLDIMMPKLDGNSVNLKLKAKPETANIPVIVMTAYGNFKKLLEVKDDMNVSAFIEKPFPIGNMIDKIREILRQ